MNKTILVNELRELGFNGIRDENVLDKINGLWIKIDDKEYMTEFGYPHFIFNVIVRPNGIISNKYEICFSYQ